MASPSSSSDDLNENEVRRLVALAQEGDEDSFAELVYRHRELIYSVAWRMTRDSDSAMDVTQEVFVRAWRALRSFHGNAQFSTWLHRIALNTCVDWLRREKRHDAGSLDDLLAPKDGMPVHVPQELKVEPQQAMLAEAREVHQRVTIAVEELSPKQRQAFILRYWAELPVQDIAKTMKCTEGAIKRHLFRALGRLRDLLKDMDPSS